MNTAFRLLMMAMLLAALSACKKDVVVPDTGDTGDTDTTQTDPSDSDVDTNPLNARDYSDSRNFENPDSLLSRSVIYFEFDQSTLRPGDREILSAHSAYLSSYPNAQVRLEGHADERGSREYNLGLGERRGNSANGFMSASGARGSQMEVVSYGEEQPECRESTEECWARNRRVVIDYIRR